MLLYKNKPISLFQFGSAKYGLSLTTVEIKLRTIHNKEEKKYVTEKRMLNGLLETIEIEQRV